MQDVLNHALPGIQHDLQVSIREQTDIKVLMHVHIRHMTRLKGDVLLNANFYRSNDRTVQTHVHPRKLDVLTYNDPKVPRKKETDGAENGKTDRKQWTMKNAVLELRLQWCTRWHMHRGTIPHSHSIADYSDSAPQQQRNSTRHGRVTYLPSDHSR